MTGLPLLIAVLRAPQRMAQLSLPEWDLLLRQALAANLTATLHGLAVQAGVLAQVPPAPARHLAWAATLLRRHAQGVQWEVNRIATVLAPLGVPLLLLKGAAYVMAGLPAARGRLFSDVDILVPRGDIDRVEAGLMLAGWFSQHHDAYDQRYYRVWMHEIPPMQHMHRASTIDVHHAILPLTAAARPDSALLRGAAVPLAAPGVPGSVRVLAPADMVIHSATHLFWDGEFGKGLRDLFDLHRLLVDFGARQGFWEQLPARAVQLELARPLFYALRYAARVLHTPVPDAVLAALAPAAPNKVLLALMDALFARALMPLHASCDGALSAPARWLLYVRGNWLRMPPLLLARHLFHKAFISPPKGR